MNCHQLLISKLLGGAAGIGLAIGKALRDRGDGARVWLPEMGPAATRARDLDLPLEIYRLSPLMARSRAVALMANWLMGHRLRRRGGSLAHFHSPYLYGLLRFAARRSRMRSIAHVHLEEEKEGLTWALKRPPDVIITCAKFLVPLVRESLPETSRDRQRIVAVPNAVDMERFHPGDRRAHKAKLGADPNVPLILMLANLAPHKGQETAIRAIAELKRRGIRCRLWMAGSERGTGDHTGKLRMLMEEEQVTDVAELLGQRQDAPDLLRAADALVLPSRREGLPLCLLEAQATKVPVIAAGVSGVPEVVKDGETGFLVPADDVRAYADRIQQVLGSPDFSRRLADRAFKKVQSEHSWRTYLRAVLDVYDEALERPPGDPGD